LTPFFGSIYDRYGKGATLMVIGSIILTVVHCIFAIPGITAVAVAIAAMILLGIAFGLVPSAMWPSVPKIIPMQLLGTAYAVIFYIQNIGLSMVPILIGKVNQANTTNDVTDYTTSMAIFAACGIISIVIAVMLKMEDKKKGYGLEQANIKK
ncbi:MAG: MFS transporter, partial [Bacteroidaceae bacterium]|nr:MFS transporter [Bacteroidaceae bacterium]